MPHLIEPFENVSLEAAAERLVASHDFLLECVAGVQVAAPPQTWAINTKRVGVSLLAPGRPPDIGKPSEALGELLNLLATVERLIAGLAWFSAQAEFATSNVLACHPTTSDSPQSNDLVLSDTTGNRIALVEVCDVASANGDGNKKEQASIQKLGCSVSVPDDGARRFIICSPEFARQLSRRRRGPIHYQCTDLEVGDAANTRVCELLRPDA